MQAQDYENQPACTVEPAYWRNGLRWEVVLQVMYWSSGTERAAGKGPFFSVGHAWTEDAARARVLEMKDRLERSRLDVARLIAR